MYKTKDILITITYVTLLLMIGLVIPYLIGAK
jgi:hypothetical protein